MKHIVLFVMLCIGADFALAQVTKIDTVAYPDPILPKKRKYNFNTDYWYTVAVRAYAYEQFPSILNQPSGQPFQTSYLNGILFKVNDNQIGYRLQAAYFDKDISFDNECDGCATANGGLKNTTVKIGVEKTVNYSRFQPYFGTDIGFMIQRFNGIVGPIANPTVKAEDSKNALLVSPLVGFKIYVVPRLAVGVEANFTMAYTYQKSNQYARLKDSEGNYTDKVEYETIPNQTKRYRWEYFFAPVAAITLQYSFGLINQ